LSQITFIYTCVSVIGVIRYLGASRNTNQYVMSAKRDIGEKERTTIVELKH